MKPRGHSHSLFVLLLVLLRGLASVAIAAPAQPSHEVLLVIGAPGEETYRSGFNSAAEAWTEACRKAQARLTVVGLEAGSEGNATDKARIEKVLRELEPSGPIPVWVVYVGHGTFDRKEAWWNLRGPDVSGAELAQWLTPMAERTVIVVHGGSASGPFIPLFSGRNRIIISATRSGDEVNYARFGERFAHAIASSRADLDQDGSTSLLEAFLQAAKEAQTLYTENGRMATEHALLDDNGDKLGTPVDWFQGVRVVKRPDGQTAAPDGFRAHQLALLEASNAPVLTPEQRQLRDELEQELEAVRRRQGQLSEPEYLRELERVLRRLSELYSPAR